MKTSTEWAEQIVPPIYITTPSGPVDDSKKILADLAVGRNKRVAEVASIIDQVVAAERERCAKIATSIQPHRDDRGCSCWCSKCLLATDIAEAIRKSDSC